MKPSLSVDAHINVAAVQVKDRFFRFWVYRKNSIAHRINAHVVIGLFLLFPTVGGCTAIVAILVNNQTLVIAADSKQITFINNRTVGTESVCKIHVGHQFGWAVFGVVDDTNWHIKTDINRIANTSDSATSKVMRLDELMFTLLHHEAEQIRTRDPQFFQDFLKGAEISSVLFVGFDNGRITVSNRDYLVSLIKGRINIESKWAKDCPGKDCFSTQMFVIGSAGAIQEYIFAHHQARFPETVQAAMDTAIRLVQLQMDATPESVGPPIETAIIDGQGVHWGEHNTECHDTRKPAKPTIKPTPKNSKGR